MANSSTPTFTVADFVASLNQTLSYAYPDVIIVGEVANFNSSQGKWFFWDLKHVEVDLEQSEAEAGQGTATNDTHSPTQQTLRNTNTLTPDPSPAKISCFGTAWQLKTPLENGWKIKVKARPEFNARFGKFSLIVTAVQPIGAGSIKLAFERLKAKLTQEGLFAPERKRPLPRHLNRIAVISSTEAAGYKDFIKILGERTGGLVVDVIHTQVQGLQAPEQIIRALQKLNEKAEAEVIVLIRGGGSADDLAAFNDETLTRAIATSKIPTITGIGHEIDITLADLAADVRASTPSNAAELLVPDKRAFLAHQHDKLSSLHAYLIRAVEEQSRAIDLQPVRHLMLQNADQALESVRQKIAILNELNPDRVLERGYAIIRNLSDSSLPSDNKPKIGADLEILRQNDIILAEVKEIHER
ncbi:exodeoxyribonuclease VII large subunit [Candidatus Saccharibacteria bacterium]|nr:exodeoxyribonuclease VII large subunit [Candidatus Saccharibacteria bacterium]